MANPKKKLTKEEKLEKKRLAERRRYEMIMRDPERAALQKEKERQKYLKKKEKGQRKLVSDMTDREKRQTRKNWRRYASTYYSKASEAKKRTKDFIRDNTPSSIIDSVDNLDLPPQNQPLMPQESPTVSKPSTPQALRPTLNLTPRLVVARERSKKLRMQRNRVIKAKDNMIEKLQTDLKKYKKRYERLKKKQNPQTQEKLTPNTKMTQLAEDPATRRDVVKKALFGEVLEQQIAENLPNLKTCQEKKAARKLLVGSVVERRKVWKLKNKILSYKKIWYSYRHKKTMAKQTRCLKEKVKKFLEDDKYSRVGAGKKEYATKNKIRRQKRYRLDTLKNLHKDFLKTGQGNISYSMFAKLTPFWIVAPKVTDRDTCMCLIHGNIQLIISALYNARVLKIPNYQNLLIHLCCDRYNESCLERTCDLCSENTIPFNNEIVDSREIEYKQWTSSRETIRDLKTNKDRTVVKQKKISIRISIRELIQKLENDLPKVLNHEKNIVHQYQTIKSLKESLTEKDAVIHMDFSENYCTKYSEEVQSFHFGGSRTQLSLHTVVVYLKNSTRSYCTVSDNLSHNVPAIWAHLKPVLEELPNTIENIHFVSDGPVTQYRNKLMFYVLACKMFDLCPGLINWTWNYSEAGHGKGAPDGVGAVCKRTADSIVACGGDITNLNEFCSAVQNRCPNITIFIVTDCEIQEMNQIISTGQNVTCFTGTLKVHQVQANAFLPRKLLMKSLSCFCGSDVCDHYRLGILKYPEESRPTIEEVFSDTSSETGDTQNHKVNPRKRKTIKETSTQNKAQTKKRRESKQTQQKKRKLGSKENKTVRQKNENLNKLDDCMCIFCGTWYSEDTTGADWVQCKVCSEWAQITCIKTDPNFFVCPECTSDCDYNM